MISRRAQLLKPSPTLAMAARARELQAQGKDIVSLTVGEPDWPSFEVAAKAGIEAIQSGFTKYTAAQGIPELRKAVASQTKQQLGVEYADNQVVIGSGAKYILYSALMMLIDPGDEVLIPAPYWVSYPTMVELAGGLPRIVETSAATKFKMSGAQLKNAITNKTKALILCSPSNPTGFQYSKNELQDLAEVLKAHPQVFIISDDIYNRLVFDGEILAPHLLHVAPQLKDRLMVVNGASKSYSMTGWRVGWGLGPLSVMQPMADFLSQTTSNVSSVSQKAALKAVEAGEPDLQKAVQQLKNKKDSFGAALQKVSDFDVMMPDGAFYFWLGIGKLLGRKHQPSGKVLNNSKDVAEVLLDQYFLATVPGFEFGCEGYLRLSFATSEANLKKAAERLTKFAADTK